MAEWVEIAIFPLFLTLATYQVGLFLQRKSRSSLCSPILVSVVLVLLVLHFTGMKVGTYQAGTQLFSWLLTPATVCLAIPMYQHFQVLRQSFPAILVGVSCGALSCMVMVILFGAALGWSGELTISLLPKSVTTAIGVPLSEMAGGIPAVTTAAIVLTGNLANILGNVCCKLFRLTDPVAQGVALGTSGHVIATAKANELSALAGAAGSLALVVAGLLTALLLPLAAKFL